MIIHSTHSDDYLWYLICVEIKKKKNYKTPEYKVPPHFLNGRNNMIVARLNMKSFKIESLNRS